MLKECANEDGKRARGWLILALLGIYVAIVLRGTVIFVSFIIETLGSAA
jgi:hypothetical protein